MQTREIMSVNDSSKNDEEKIIEKIKNIKMSSEDNDEKIVKKISDNKYMLISKEYIKNYNDINLDDKIAFDNEIQKAKFCRKVGENGIKILSGDNVKCNVVIDNEQKIADSVCELKIKGPNRILLFSVQIVLDDVPVTLLIASHYVQNGFHATSAKKKLYTANELFVKKDKQPEFKNASKIGFFSTKNNDKAKRAADFYQGLIENKRDFEII
jgi:hypothetical protein